MKNSLLINYFLVNLVFSCWISMCFENVLYKDLYSGKNGVCNGSQMIKDSFQTLTIIAENLHF